MGRPFSPRDRFRRDNEPRTRINDAIRVREVRLIDENGQQLGIKPIRFAQDYANERGLDLVEVAPQAEPPVCRVMNFSKYRYEQELKAKAARKHQSQIVIKEIKFRPKVGVHDYETKKGHVLRFLKARDKVKVTIMFRGREMVHPERGEALLMRLFEDIKEYAVIESPPNLDGRNMIMMLAPTKEMPVKDAPAEGAPATESAAEAAPAEAPVAEKPAKAPAAKKPPKAAAEDQPPKAAPAEEEPAKAPAAKAAPAAKKAAKAPAADAAAAETTAK
ncbi:MAG TPA: translation initiation factor IF-3 [Thermoleophilia bacterium]|nr:translation initiation factor IF-3 [Thermoleophilia bacterium]